MKVTNINNGLVTKNNANNTVSQIQKQTPPIKEIKSPTPSTIFMEKHLDKKPAIQTINVSDVKKHVSLAKTYYINGNFEESYKKLEEAINARSNYGKAYLIKGRILLTQGRLDEAEKELKNAITHMPNNYQAYMKLANVYIEKRELDTAGEVIKKAIQIYPNNFKAYYKLGLILSELYYPEKAANALKQAIRLNPNSFKAYYQLGQIYYSKGKYTMAGKLFNKAYRIKPDNADAVRDLGHVYEKLSNYDRAHYFYRKALLINPQDNHTHILIGNLYTKLKNYSQAKNSYRTAINIDPYDFRSHFALGQLHYLKGEKKDAILSHLNSIKLNNDSNNKSYLILLNLAKKFNPIKAPAKFYNLSKPTRLELVNTVYQMACFGVKGPFARYYSTAKNILKALTDDKDPMISQTAKDSLQKVPKQPTLAQKLATKAGMKIIGTIVGTAITGIGAAIGIPLII